MKRIVNTLDKLSSGKRACAVFVLCATTAIALPAQTFTTLYSFDGSPGIYPYGGLVQTTNGDLYGTTSGGSTNTGGTVFKITPAGTLTTLYNFCSQGMPCTDGDFPYGTLVQAINGDLYGTTLTGGANCDTGTVFKMTPSGKLTTLYSFCAQSGCTDGTNPYTGLVQATNGDFYGTTSGGGNDCGSASCGTVFKITPSGTLTTLYSFCAQSGCTDGANPYGGLVQATNGDLYGTTNAGGNGACSVAGCGTIFKITPSGTLTTLHSFDGTDGQWPYAGLVQATNGDFYGTTSPSYGGATGYGTIFKMTPTGTLTTLHRFCSQVGCADGYFTYAALVQATDGDLYGTTDDGGAGVNTPYCIGCGTIFKITPTGTLTTLYNFCSQSGCPGGYYPYSALVQATNGDFYGTTYEDGGHGLQPVRRSRPLRENPDHLRHGRSGRQDSGQRSDRRDQRHL
jgi:uncharacterized repeat protein (TIGR03803 family)